VASELKISFRAVLRFKTLNSDLSKPLLLKERLIHVGK
jgi:hypothetical protein